MNLQTSLKLKLILDIGCGDGQVAKLITEKRKLKYIGIDISETAVYKARQISPNLCFIVADATRLPFKRRSFDYIVSNHNLEHIPDDDTAIYEMGRVLKSGGKLYLATPNANYFPAFKYYRKKSDKVGGHIRLYTKDAIVNKLQKRDFRVDKVEFYWHIFYHFGYRYFHFLFNTLFRAFSHLTGYRGHIYDCKLYPVTLMYKILEHLLNLENKLTRFTNSHLALYLIATKINRDIYGRNKVCNLNK